MKVSGTANLNAPAERVWAALNDPAVLVRTIPGCERLENTGTDRYRMMLTAGVASIKGSYLGEVELADHVPYSAFTLRASGSGAPGTVSAEVKVTLDERDDGTTLLGYAADAVVGGTIGGVGQRVLGGVAKKLAGEFFQAVNAQLDGGTTTAGPAAATITGGPTPLGEPALIEATGQSTDSPSMTVFTRRPAEFTRRPAERANTSRTLNIDVRNQLPGVAAGAAIALLGVLLGSRIARR